MNFVADENVDASIIDGLRKAGHDVVAIAEIDPSALDEFVLAAASKLEALLLTADTDFGELVFRQGRVSDGVILIRLAGLASRAKADIVLNAVTEHGHEMSGRFTVIGAQRIRIRTM